MDRLSNACNLFSLTISLKKTQVMGQAIPLPPSIRINEHKLEIVNQFQYLVSTATDSLSLDTEISKRIGKAATTPILNKSKNVHLTFGRFPFHSHIHPTRCLNCQTYSHNITKCHNPRVCEHCGKDHWSDNCPETSPSLCVPCFKSKRSCHDHVTSSSSCLLYRQQVRLKMGRTAWE